MTIKHKKFLSIIAGMLIEISILFPLEEKFLMNWRTAVKIFFSTLIVVIAGFAGIIVYEAMLEKRAQRLENLFLSTNVEFESKQETLGEFLNHFENFAKLMEPRLQGFEFVVMDGIDLDTKKEVHFGPPPEPEPLSKRLESELLTYSTYFGQELNNPGPPGLSVRDTIPVHTFRGSQVLIMLNDANYHRPMSWSEKIYHGFVNSEFVTSVRAPFD